MLSTCCGPQHVRSSEVIPEEDFSEILVRALKKDIVDKENCEMTPENGGDEKDEFIQHLEILSKLEVEKTNNSDDQKIDEPLSEQKWTGSILFLKKYVS